MKSKTRIKIILILCGILLALPLFNFNYYNIDIGNKSNSKIDTEISEEFEFKSPKISFEKSWVQNGVVISNESDTQNQIQLCSDGEGGAIITWRDARKGSDKYNIYAQRINSTGHTQWTANGTAICNADDLQEGPQIIEDDAGGAIIAWHDRRSGSHWDIYAQRINSTGHTQWTANGTGICTASGIQVSPQLCSDGAGGAIIAWNDGRDDPDDDIYAQRINSTGHTQWTNNGTVICNASDKQTHHKFCSDGTGGAIITWEDRRSGSNYDIYAQRVDSNGNPKWGVNGRVICTASGEQSYPQLCSDGVGGAIITWQDHRGVTYDIYAQRVDSNGNPKWGVNGRAICMASGEQSDPQLCSDDAGGGIITWKDYRGATYDIYAQRIDFSGIVQWTANGTAICTASGEQSDPQLCSDSVGGAIITWKDYRGATYDIYAQRIDFSGIVQWTANGTAICTASGTQGNPHICTDGNGGAIIVWEDERTSFWDVYAQYIKAHNIPICTADNDQLLYSLVNLCSDGMGGAIVVWDDIRNGANNDIYAQRIGSNGFVQWTADGVPICTVIDDQTSAGICSDDSGGAFIVWEDERYGALNDDIYAQRVNSNGKIQWSINGTVICNATDQQRFAQIISDDAGGAIIVWEDDRNGASNRDLFAQRIDSEGNTLWTDNGTAICTANNQQELPIICSDGNEGAIIVWGDQRIAPTVIDLYAQRVDSGGNVKWTTDGIPICTENNNQEAISICSDGMGGIITAWYDERIVYPNIDIYAQRIDFDGNIKWTTNGVPICNNSEYQGEAVLCSDGAGGAIIVWPDCRDDPDHDLYAQRVDSNGKTLWTNNGTVICNATDQQRVAQIISDDAGGAIITWEDKRSGSNYDIYAQHIGSDGMDLWGTNGMIISNASMNQRYSQVTYCGAGSIVIIWMDGRNYNYDIYGELIKIPVPISIIINGGGGGGGDDNGKGEEEAIHGYNLLALIGIAAIITVIITKKYRKYLHKI